MSDLSDLHGIFPDSLRWNAETGTLGIGVFSPESGEREVREILLGNTATFVMDLATRERGYGMIKIGVYDMRLTPVGSPRPDWPGEEFKPALGCWVWSPALGELRLEVCSAIFRTAIADVWDRARSAPEFMKGLQPAIRFVDRVDVPVKAVGKTFFGPVVQIVGWTERGNVPGWRERAPTVPLPAASPALVAPSTPAPATTPSAPAPTPAVTPSKAKSKAKKDDTKPGPDDPGPIDPNLNDPIPR